MKIDAATEAEILAVVMRWTSIVGDHAVYRRHDDSIRVYADSNDYEGRIVSPAIALAWALTVETDPEPVDVGRCPACVDTGSWKDWECPACDGTGRETLPLARLLLDAVTDATAQARLAAHADRLCADGWLLGELLMAALRWIDNALPMEATRPDGTKVVSHMHTLDALRWLEWLTYAALEDRVANMYDLGVRR